MRYHLTYNENIGRFMLVETGKTLLTVGNEQDYKAVGSSDDLQELKTFVMAVKFLYVTYRTNDSVEFRDNSTIPYSDIITLYIARYDDLHIFTHAKNDF